jgi:hypothetical protein
MAALHKTGSLVVTLRTQNRLSGLFLAFSHQRTAKFRPNPSQHEIKIVAVERCGMTCVAPEVARTIDFLALAEVRQSLWLILQTLAPSQPRSVRSRSESEWRWIRGNPPKTTEALALKPSEQVPGKSRQSVSRFEIKRPTSLMLDRAQGFQAGLVPRAEYALDQILK